MLSLAILLHSPTHSCGTFMISTDDDAPAKRAPPPPVARRVATLRIQNDSPQPECYVFLDGAAVNQVEPRAEPETAIATRNNWIRWINSASQPNCNTTSE